MYNVGLYTFRRRLRSYLYDTHTALHHHHRVVGCAMFMIVVAAAAATVAPASYAVPETAEKATSPWGPRAVAVAEVSSWTVAVC